MTDELMLCKLLLPSYMTTLRQLTPDGNITEYTDSISNDISEYTGDVPKYTDTMLSLKNLK